MTEAALMDLLEAHAPEAGLTWLRGRLERLGRPLHRGRFWAAFAGAGRHLGGDAVPFATGIGPEGPGQASCPDLARALLLLRAVEVLDPEEQVAFVTDLYAKGEAGEQQAILRALSWLPDPRRFLPLAVEACRTNAEALFAAIACDNPFPATHFPEPSFNQLVLKTLFLGLPARRILGLEKRVTGELLRMIGDFEAERAAAGRPVPQDAAWIRSLPEASA